MHLYLALFLTFLATDVDAAANCSHGSPTEAFASSYYAALFVTHDREIVSGLSLPGQEAADIVYKVITDILHRENQCNAEWVAFTASRAVALADPLLLSNYLEKTAYNIGDFLQIRKVLKCNNAVSLALRAFQFVQKAFHGLDDTQFESYARAFCQGIVYLVKDLGFKLNDVTQQLADIFYAEFSMDKQDQCMATDHPH